MSTLTILIVLPLLIIFSYLFDIISRKTKFPAVILLMFTGIIIRTGTTLYGFTEFGFLENLIPCFRNGWINSHCIRGGFRTRHKTRQTSRHSKRLFCGRNHFDPQCSWGLFTFLSFFRDRAPSRCDFCHSLVHHKQCSCHPLKCKPF